MVEAVAEEENTGKTSEESKDEITTEATTVDM